MEVARVAQKKTLAPPPERVPPSAAPATAIAAVAQPNAVPLAIPAPVQVQTLEVRQASEPTQRSAARTHQPTAEGDFWTDTVRAFIQSQAINALVRELALQSELVGRDTDQWQLRIESESLSQGAARERLQTALQGAGHNVKLVIEIGRVNDSPAQRNAAVQAQRQKAAEDLIQNDPMVQSLMRDFDAKIVPGSIKPI